MSSIVNNRRVLIVDDNEQLHADYRKCLIATADDGDLKKIEEELFGPSEQAQQKVQVFELTHAHQGKDGLEAVNCALASNKPFALAFVDMRMPPGWDGLETISHLWKVDPALQIVLCTAYSDYTWDEILSQVQYPDQLLILKKPFEIIEVRQLALSLTEKWALRNELNATIRGLEETVEKLQHANRAKSAFLANMSHEIRTPLNGIQGTLQLLAKTELTHSQRRFTELATASSKTLIYLINDILDFSKIEAGKMELSEEFFDVRTMVEEATLQATSLAESKGLFLSTYVAPDVPEKIWADKMRMSQVLVNFVGNSVKFTATGSIHISICVKESSENRVLLHVEVRDTGIGIPEENRDSIFSPFTQADLSTTKKFGGTGLGLSICAELLKLMGGQIGVESALDKGSVFWFSLWAKKENELLETNRYLHVETSRFRVLLVATADEQSVYSKQLLSWGLRVDCIGSISQLGNALSEAERGSEPFTAVIISDAVVLECPAERESLLQVGAEFSCRPVAVIVGSRGDTNLPEIFKSPPCKFWCRPVRQSNLFDDLISVLASFHGIQLPEQAALAANRLTIARKAVCDVKILVAEDNETNQVVISEFLKEFGLAHTIVPNGQRVLEAAQREQFDLIFMDCHMPEMDGFEAARKIREFESQAGSNARRTPIVALTADATLEALDRCVMSGMDGTITKPLDSAKLVEVLRRFIDPHTGAESARMTVPPGKHLVEGACASDEFSPALACTDLSDPIDSKMSLERFGGNVNFLKIVLKSFEKQVRADLPTVAQCIQDGDAKRLFHVAHALKGAAAAAGAEKFREIALQLEQLGRAESLSGTLPLYEALHSEAERCLDFISRTNDASQLELRT